MAFIELDGTNAFANPTVDPAETSDIYLLPAHSNKSVGISWDTGTPKVYFTFSSEEKIRDSSAQWVLWDNESIINPAVTGVYVENDGGSAITLEIAARVG